MHIKAVKIVYLLFFLLHADILFAQLRPDIVGINAKSGFILPHHKTFLYFLNGQVPAFELNLLKHSSGKDWQKAHKMPDYGIGFYYTDFRSPKVLGRASGLYGTMIRPLIVSDNFRFSYRYAAGISYNNRNFHHVNNPYNIAFSTKINALVILGAEAEISAKKNTINIGAGVTHISNGAFKKPNSGINYFNLSAGFNYYLRSRNKTENLEYRSLKRNEFILRLAAAGHQKSLLKKIYPAGSFSIEYLRRTNLKYAFGGGAVLFYDAANNYYSPADSIAGSPRLSPLYAGAHLSYRIYYGNLFLNYQFGAYFYERSAPNEALYSRIGIGFYFTEKLSAGFALKNYFGTADFIELGFAFRFSDKP